ncbi:hypothetical protein PSN_2716 [Pseudomonas sp. NGC7]
MIYITIEQVATAAVHIILRRFEARLAIAGAAKPDPQNLILLADMVCRDYGFARNFGLTWNIDAATGAVK